MVYFAYGATGLVGVAQSFWIRNSLTWSPAELASLAIWFTLPWTIKMVFGELVDTVPLLGSQRRAYVFIGASLIAAGVRPAGRRRRRLDHGRCRPIRSTSLPRCISVTGVVLQDVVADAMSTEVVPRHNPDGRPRPKQEIDHDLGMVQVLGRLALSFGIFSVAGLSGWLAQYLSYDKVFLLGLIVPVISVTGALLVRLETSERRADRLAHPRRRPRLRRGGHRCSAVSGIGYGQEIIFVISMAVVIWMLTRVTQEIDHATRMRIAFAAIIIFAFRTVPGVGDGYTWFAIDVLGFDEAFFGVLGQIGAGVAIVAAWMLSDVVTRKPVAQVLLWITILGTILSLPSLLLVFQLLPDDRTAVRHRRARHRPVRHRRHIAVRAAQHDPAADARCRLRARPGHRATWFALMASLMNLALVAGGMLTKYLNLIFPVNRGVLSQPAGAGRRGLDHRVRRCRWPQSPSSAAACGRARPPVFCRIPATEAASGCAGTAAPP